MTEDDNTPEARAAAAAKLAATEESRRQMASELALSAEEVAALTEASKSLDSCWTGEPASCPKELKSMFTQKPFDLFAMLRNPNEDAPAEVWVGVRERWPVLTERSDEELLAALQPIKDVYVDKRSLR